MLGFDRSQESTSESCIRGAEVLFCIKYPEPYRTMVRDYGGAYGDVAFRVDSPSPGFDLCSVGLIHSLNPCSRNSVYSRMSSWQENDLSDRIIPFAEDGGGNYVCLDYRQSDVPQIAFWFHELAGDDGLMKVCDTFEEFLERLQLPDENA